MQPYRARLGALCCSVVLTTVLPATPASAAPSVCATVLSGKAVAGPTVTSAWRVQIEARTAVFYHLPGSRLSPSRWLEPTDAAALLVLSRGHAADGRCWLRVRLPWRPNDATGWINARKVVLQKTPWRIAVSTDQRALTLFRAGAPVRTFEVVVGKPSTPTPEGLFAITWAIPWYPNEFLGSWVLDLTAHSDVLKQFDGGIGTVAIHGRGGSSLLDPVGTAASHGCVRVANDAIDWLVRTIGEHQVAGTPVRIS